MRARSAKQSVIGFWRVYQNMEIIQLHLKHFGKFTDYRLDLHAGINVISGGNETGKSTLHAFIRAMLYGVSRNRSRSLDEYQLREPWDNPAYFAGSMKLLYEGKIYRIDRNFYRREESVEVVCETDGTQAEDPNLAIKYFVGGLSEADFDNTVFIRQAQSETGSQLSSRLRDCMVNREAAAGDSPDVSAALEYLKKKRKKIDGEKKAALGRIEEEIREKTRESEYVQRDLESLLEKQSKDGVTEKESAPYERIVENVPAGDAEDGRGTEDGNTGSGARTGHAEPGGGARTGHGESGSGDQTGYAGTGGVQDQEETAPGTGRMPDQDEASEDTPADTPEDTPAPETEPEETSGVLPPVMLLLSFAATLLLCACAFLSADRRIRYLTLAGAVLTGITAAMLLWRILHPVSRSEQIRRKIRREEFLNRHLGFREDPEDPADREQALRRGQRARDAILRAKEEEEQREQIRAEQNRIRLEQALELQQKEEMARRGKDVERIARSQVFEREISLRRQKLDELRSQLEELYRKKAALGQYDEEIRAVGMAESRIRELAGTIVHESGDDFSKEVSALLSGLTDGRYTRISLDDSMVVRLNTPDRLLTLDQISFGTMQQVYFALRLASAGILSKSSEVPVILDEPFAMYDEERLERALRILSGSARQVILFTCQTRELDILKRI